MNIARQIFNNQHCTTELTDLFAKDIKLMRQIMFFVGCA